MSSDASNPNGGRDGIRAQNRHFFMSFLLKFPSCAEPSLSEHRRGYLSPKRLWPTTFLNFAPPIVTLPGL
jgi:hypothetical protein